MRSKSILLSATAIMVVLVLFGSTLVANVNEGLISHWRFDEGGGTMAYDSAGTNDGTVYGAIWTTGQINGALSFDGLNDYVCVPDNYSLDLGTHDLSFAFWFKTNESSIKQILTKRSTTTGPSNRVWDGYSSALFEDGTVAVWFRHSASSDSGVIVSSNASYNDGNWHHLAGVYTRSANLELYVDGVPEGTPGDISYAENKDINLTQPLAIGCRVVHGRSNDLYFKGTIDDVLIYDRPLSAAEIMELYSLSDMGPIAHWKFDEGSGTMAYDSAGDNDGTIYGATWTTGKIDGALSFDGVDDYVEIGPGVMPVGEKSLFSWVKMPPVGQCSGVDCDYLIYHGIDSDAGGTVLYYNNGVELRWFNPHSGGFDAKHTVAVDNNQWHFVGFVYDGGVYRLYLDGNDIASSTGCDHSTIISYEGIGGFNGDYLLRSWYGIIDDVRIYDRALSAEEILALYKGIITVGLDIKPGSCPNPLNVKSRGLLPVAVLGSEDFDVNTIDIASIRLAGIAPIRSSYEDVAAPVSDANECECSTEGPDGFTDLILKFETQMIVEAIGEVEHGDELVLALTGVLSDETPIVGSDCIIIRGRHKPLNRADFNGDGKVDMADFAAFAQNWLQSSIADY